MPKRSETLKTPKNGKRKREARNNEVPKSQKAKEVTMTMMTKKLK